MVISTQEIKKLNQQLFYCVLFYLLNLIKTQITVM